MRPPRWIFPYLHGIRRNICKDLYHAPRLHDLAYVVWFSDCHAYGRSAERRLGKSKAYQDGKAVELFIESNVIRGTRNERAPCQMTRQHPTAALQARTPLPIWDGDNKITVMIDGSEYHDAVAAFVKKFAHWPRAGTNFVGQT